MKGDYYVPEMGRKSRFASDKSGKLYLIEVCDMGAYLTGKYGIAENYRGSKDKMIAQIIVRKGILALGDRHIELWNRTKIHRHERYMLSDLWEAGSTLEKGIFF